jgi:hypothetical protein
MVVVPASVPFPLESAMRAAGSSRPEVRRVFTASPDRTDLGCGRSSQLACQASAAPCQSVLREENEVKGVLRGPRSERWLGRARESRERRARGCGSQQISRVAKVVFGLSAHRAVVRRSAAAAAFVGPRLWCERNHPQVGVGICQYGCRVYGCLAAAAGFEDDENLGIRSGIIASALAECVFGRRCSGRHATPIMRLPH